MMFKPFQPAPETAPEKEREWFNKLADSEVPTRSGTQKDRRLVQTSFRAFFEEVYLPAVSKTSFTKRTQQTVINWVQELGIRPCVFDRYRCEICYLGRPAESRERSGNPLTGDKELLAKYHAHQKVVANQAMRVKEDKTDVGPDELCCVFDYSTFHDYTKQKAKNKI